MTLFALSLDHHRAPLDVREKCALGELEAAELGSMLVDEGFVREAVVLSTCNRFEIYCACERSLFPKMMARVSAHLEMATIDIEAHASVREEMAVVSHLLRVTASLESVIIGEPQIVGQVKRAYKCAQDASSVGKELNTLFQSVLHQAKDIRERSGIAESAVSLSFAGVELAKNIFGELSGLTCLLIGVGEMGRLAANHFVERGAALQITNRSYEKAVELSEVLGATPISFTALEGALTEVDVVLTATGAPHHIISKQMMTRVGKRRRYKEIFMIDIAVPRDIEPSCTDIEGVYCYDVDDLGAVIDKNKAERLKRAESAELMVREAVSVWHQKTTLQNIDEGVRVFRQHFVKGAEAERQRFVDNLDVPEADKERLKHYTHQMINRLLHDPTTRLKQAIVDDNLSSEHVLLLLEHLFGEEKGRSISEENHAHQHLQLVESAAESMTSAVSRTRAMTNKTERS